MARARFRRVRRALEITRVARGAHILRVLREIGVAGERRATAELGQIVDQLESGTLKVGIAPKDLGGLDHLLRSTANRIGAAMIVVGLLVSSALMARVNDAVAIAGFALSSAIALYMIWKILRTPGEL